MAVIWCVTDKSDLNEQTLDSVVGVCSYVGIISSINTKIGTSFWHPKPEGH